MVGMIGRKVGMMRLYDGAGRARAVTVIELGPNRVTQLRTAERDGYEAVQVGFSGNRKRINRPERGHLRPSGRAVQGSGDCRHHAGRVARRDRGRVARRRVRATRR